MERVPTRLKITRARCSSCGRSPLVEHGFLVTHREDPPSTVVCGGSGSWAAEPRVEWIEAERSGIVIEVWRYSNRAGLYFLGGVGMGMSFSELEERASPTVRVEFGPPMDEE